MISIPDSLLSYFTATIQQQDDGTYVVEIPENELETGSLDMASEHKVAVFGTSEEQDTQETTPSTKELGPGPTPPVREGETRTVEIVDEGTEGDGIARIDEGYVVIVPDGTVGDTCEIEVIAVKEQFAIGERVQSTE